MNNLKRNLDLKVRVTKEEKEHIQHKMLIAGTKNFNQYAIKMLMDGYIIHNDFKEIKEVTYQLSKIGNNINQFAKKANESNKVEQEDIDEVILLLKEIRKLVSKELTNTLHGLQKKL